MLRNTIFSTRLLAHRTRAVRTYASSSSGGGNAGKQGPLTGKTKAKAAEKSESTQGAESSSPPKTAPGQGVEDKGGHAVPHGPGPDGKFAEQGDSALKVAGAVDSAGSEKEDGRDQKVDAKFWSDKK